MSAAYTLCAEARRLAGLSQRALADRAGVSPSTVARIERGRMEPTLELLDRLIRACGLELRLRIVEHDGTGGAATVDLETRLRSLRSLSEFAIAARGAR
ncbi:MAG: helix-turn-helix transcriptional regulator [Acidimicrobiia bacterium]